MSDTNNDALWTIDELVSQAEQVRAYIRAIVGEINGELSKIDNALEAPFAASKNDIRYSVIRARALLERLK